MATFADQINHRPVPLAHLDVLQLQANEFRSAKAATEQHGQHGVIALRPHTVTASTLQNFRTLFNTQPIPGTEPQLFDAFDSADPGSQLGAQQTGVGRFVSQAAHGCQLLVDGVGGQMPRFQVYAIAHHHDPVESQPWLGAIPGDELIDGILIDAARSWRAETVENGGFAVIEIRQAEYSATVIRSNSGFVHWGRPPMP